MRWKRRPYARLDVAIAAGRGAVKSVPVIDIEPLISGAGDVGRVVEEIDRSCRDLGFFYVIGHGVDGELIERLESAARRFFALPEEEKAEIGMTRGGRAWRGWFPVGGELTSGRADHKEGIYFGAELARDDRRVRAGLPLHGPNLFPRRPAELRPLVLTYLDEMTTLGHRLVRGMGLALGLDADWFDRNLTSNPVILFRIFHYPPAPPDDRWGVAEHTDYGLLTMLLQDASGGLEVHTPRGWVDAPPVPGSFVCNLGDMLERMTGGAYRSTPHRVRSPGVADRLSFPFFFDPGWDARVRPVLPSASADPVDFGDTYGDYLLAKVSKVFPELGADVLANPDAGVDRQR
jgi:isopenicillin N synthase-like dioxygenase